jgi:SNF2 family DNA or RNA helicase
VNYEFGTQPFSHQLEAFERTRDMAATAIFWEQGTGKTKLIIDTACWLYERGEIDALIVVAPNGVHRNWLTDELPTHTPKRLQASILGHAYQTGKAGTKWHKNICNMILEYKGGLSILCLTYDAVMTDPGRNLLWSMLSKRKVLYVADEAHRIKEPSAKRTKRVVASSKYAKYRRILTGTPVANGPFDVFSLMKFLDEGFWKAHGLDNYAAFKSRFGVFLKGYNSVQGREFDQLVGYQNLPALERIITEHSSRVLKEDVLDLPPKLYSKRYVEMTSAQRRAYEELREEFFTEIKGEMIEAPLAIVRLLRLQQVLCGYLPSEEGEPYHELEGGNPRVSELIDVVNGLPHKAIIFTRFRRDIDLITAALTKEGLTWVRYDGSVGANQREEAIARFKGVRPIMRGGQVVGHEAVLQEQQVQFIVANTAALSEGRTLTEAKTVIYYNNSFKLIEREQSEDRAHRAGQDQSVNYVDLMVADTVDEQIVMALRRKKDIAATITGDQLREWLA